MLKWFRRQRLLAALLITANPAIIGSWVTAYHPCPVRDGAALGRLGAAAVVAAPAMSEHMGHEGMVDEVPAAPTHGHDQNSGPCSCIGQCLSAGVALPSLAGDEIQVAIEITSHFAPRTSHAELAPASAPSYLLPPSTAPPTV